MSALKKPVPFGKYYLLERINVGGMAEVFKAKTFGVEGFERLLAVKRILPNIAEDEEFITMFIDEAKIAVQLQHANIAQIFDLGKVDESFFIALEFVHGRDLRSIFDRMRNKGDSLPIAMACYVTMQVCEGLDYAHNKRDAQGRELNLVHRDISPQNVLIGYEGEVKLIDFGIAKAAGKASKTQAGILKGKFGYMSPEQVRGLPIDKRSDIFAVGIVLYELLTGERLFIGESDFSTLEKVRNVEIMPPSSYNKKIPQELERVVLKALARDPEDRYANAIDLHDDLQSFLYSVGEFFSRKDLAAWMKKTFAMEIEEDSAKLEEFRQIAPPVASAEVSRKAAVAGAPSGRSAPPGGTGAKAAPKAAAPKAQAPSKGPSKGQAKDSSVHQAMGWDDEELDTQIFDKEEANPVAAEDLFFEDDDRTVANEPAPDVLELARPPELLLTPKPIELTPDPADVSEEINVKMTPPPARSLPPPPAARRPTLVGVPPPGLPLRPTGPVPTLPPPSAGPPPGSGRPAPLRRSGMNMPPAVAPPPRMKTPVPPQRFRQPVEAPFGTGGFETVSQKRPAGRGIIGLLVVGGLAAAVVAYVYNSKVKPGRLELTVTPDNAVVLIDNVKVGDHSPVSLEKSPGPYTLSVTRDGYARSDQNIEIVAGQPLSLKVVLEPSPDTGFELTSEPPGLLVWLDGNPVKVPSGDQARTPFRASRIPPTHHKLEIRGENRFKPWEQEVEIAPGDIRKIHALMIPAAGGGKAATPIPSTPTAPDRQVAVKDPNTPVTPPTPALQPPKEQPQPKEPAPGPKKQGDGLNRAKLDDGAVAAVPGPKKKKRPPEEEKEPGGGEDQQPVAVAPKKRPPPVDPDESASGGDCSITVNSVPWSEVWIDGKNTTKHTPVVDFKVPCGKHKLAFKRPDMQIDQTESITVKAGQAFKQRYTLANDD